MHEHWAVGLSYPIRCSYQTLVENSGLLTWLETCSKLPIITEGLIYYFSTHKNQSTASESCSLNSSFLFSGRFHPHASYYSFGPLTVWMINMYHYAPMQLSYLLMMCGWCTTSRLQQKQQHNDTPQSAKAYSCTSHYHISKFYKYKLTFTLPVSIGIWGCVSKNTEACVMLCIHCIPHADVCFTVYRYWPNVPSCTLYCLPSLLFSTPNRLRLHALCVVI